MKWKPFITLHLIALSLLASWLIPFTRTYWDMLDRSVFYWLNSGLEGKPITQIFWALANARIADAFGALFMGTFFFLYVVDAKREDRPARLAQFAYLCLWSELGILFTKEFLEIFLQKIQFARESPSLVLENTIMLSQAVPWVKVKDIARSCFPGDHAEILLQWTFFVSFFCGLRYGLFAIGCAIFFIIPRMIAGAHWLSDALVGSVSIALILVAWATATPFFDLCMNFFTKCIDALLKRFPFFYFDFMKPLKK